MNNIEYRAAGTDEYDEVLSLWTTVFDGADRAHIRTYLEGDPWRKPSYCQIAGMDGRIVSAVNLCRRPMRLHGETIFAGRLVSVATLPTYRRQGHSTELLRRIVAVMETEDFAFSALNTGNHAHYARHGYFRIPLPRYGLTLDGALPIPDADPGVQILPLDRWLEEAPPVYAAFNATLPLYFERTPDYWNGWLSTRSKAEPAENRLLLGLRRQGVLVGYLFGELPHEDGERVFVEEIAALEPEGLARLFAGAVRAARSVGAPGVFGPHQNGMEAILRSFGTLKIGEGGTMLRPIHATEAMMREIGRSYESGAACWWSHSDGD